MPDNFNFNFQFHLVNIGGETLDDCIQELLKLFGVEPEMSKEREEAELKFRAGMLLADHRKRIIVPTADEWIGLNQLERDGELKRKKG